MIALLVWTEEFALRDHSWHRRRVDARGRDLGAGRQKVSIVGVDAAESLPPWR